MQQQIWNKALLFTGAFLVVVLTMPVLAQNPPAQTYQPGYWQPIARVNPANPVNVTLINQTGSLLKYNFLDGRGEKDLPIGATTQLTSFPLPANLAIYNPLQQQQTAGVTYETAVTNNDVQVTIKSVPGSGFHVLNIAGTGAIYVY